MSRNPRRDLQHVRACPPLNQAPHAGLWFDKFLAEKAATGHEPAQDLVKEVAGLPEFSDYARCFRRWCAELTAAGARGYAATARSRIVIGTGNESVSETAITLHHTYGVPYLPGSALKGLAAAFARQWLGATDPHWVEGGDAYRTLFGTTAAAGYVTFFDALYVPRSGTGHLPLQKDILTIHHKDYYDGNTDAPPADWDSPTIVPFLTTDGAFAVALAFGPIEDSVVAGHWLEVAFTLLDHALQTLGIGAKTAAGYGRLALDRSQLFIGAPSPAG